MSLAVADLSVAIVVMPFVIVTDLTGGKWLLERSSVTSSSHGCDVLHCIHHDAVRDQCGQVSRLGSSYQVF